MFADQIRIHIKAAALNLADLGFQAGAVDALVDSSSAGPSSATAPTPNRSPPSLANSHANPRTSTGTRRPDCSRRD